MSAPRIRKLVTAQGAFDSVLLQGHNGHPIPWDVVVKKLAELFWFLASAFPSLVAGIREWAAAMEQRAGSALAVALPAAAVVALIVLCCCCCGYLVAGGRRRPRGPNGEEVYGRDGPVVRYGCRGGGGYTGGIFSMHPNKPIVS
ncbi:hypothetical protein CFC21_026408 [Triticum aestivum]|uniref:Uncharacterized protein n=2 Tax=Triticum aestivum TaxID=4565 RepID=A0A3B6CG89_WHEAT|nr:hypothetical protein CFC21_026408 [Triticum aestivum]